VISDVELLNQLYITNLNVYLNASVIICEKIADISKSLSENQIDLILTLSTLEKEDAISYIINPKIPIIVIGENEKYKNKFQSVKGYYDLKSILRESAKILKITSQMMMEETVGEYYPFKLETIKYLKLAPVNFFLEINKGNNEKSYSVFLTRDKSILNSLQELKNNSIECIYVLANDRLKMANSISASIIDFLVINTSLNVEEKEEIVSASMNLLASSLVIDEVSPEIVNLVNRSTKIMSEIILEVPTLTKLLKMLMANKNGFIYTHSMLCAYVASYIVKKVPWGGETHIDKINFVLFFHDIALVPVFEKYPNSYSEEEMLFIESISEEDKNLILNHARISAELVTGLKKCPIGADLMIKQHHGISNGVGFATEYRDDISPLSKIIIISEAFIEEFMVFKNKNEAINIDLILEKLNDRFPKHTYKKIIETLQTIKI
jgi:hypothetical protein